MPCWLIIQNRNGVYLCTDTDRCLIIAKASSCILLCHQRLRRSLGEGAAGVNAVVVLLEFLPTVLIQPLIIVAIGTLPLHHDNMPPASCRRAIRAYIIGSAPASSAPPSRSTEKPTSPRAEPFSTDCSWRASLAELSSSTQSCPPAMLLLVIDSLRVLHRKTVT